MSDRSGGEVLVASLLAQDATHAFGVPGESYLAVLDALHDAQRLRFFVCRHEGGAAYMAEAFGKLTGRPGLCFVTRGPGASNAAIGIHTAAQDSTPLIMFVGQVGSDTADREAFQEIDYRRMYGSVAKWVAQIERAERIPEYIAHAYRVAQSGRPGPVVLALPEDVSTARVTCTDAPRVEAIGSGPAQGQVDAVRDTLEQAIAPLVIVGGSRWDAAACHALRTFAESSGLPIACAFRNQDLFDNRHPQYAGDVGIGINPKLAARVKNADVLLVIGERLGEMTTSGYTLLDVPAPRQTLLHVHPSVEELGRVYQPAIAIAATPGAFLAAINSERRIDGARSPDAASRAAIISERRIGGARSPDAASRPAIISERRIGGAQSPSGAPQAHADYEAWRAPRPVPGAVDLWQIVRWLDERLPDDAILANGAGNYTVWLHRIFRYRGFKTQLAPYSGAMGYGVPAAVAAKAVHPQRTVVSWNGDGCFLMNGQELATAVQYGLAIIFVVIDNGMYGTIRMHQEKNYPGRVAGTDLSNPDFAAVARAYGARGETVVTTAEFAPAFERALSGSGPALLHVIIDPQALTMNASLDDLREQGRALHPAGV